MHSFFNDCLRILRETFRRPFNTTIFVRSSSSSLIEQTQSAYMAQKEARQSTRENQSAEEELSLAQNEIAKVRNSVTISPIFKLAFLSALALTVVSLLVVTTIAVFSSSGELTEYQKQLFETCSTTWKMGFGAILGLIGGKAA